MFCKNCGAEIADNATFCPKCGGQVNQASNQGNPYQGQPNQPYGGQPYGYQGGGYQPQRTNNAPGKILLLVVGIILTILAVVGVAQTLSSMGLLSLAGLGGIAVFELICVSVFGLVVGICAIALCGKPEKGNTVFIMAIIAIVFRIIDWIWTGSIFSQMYMEVPAGGIIFGIIILALVAVGGYMNKKAA